MADFYLDHGAYGTGTNRIGLDAPTTWGVPQEGDGFSTAASTAAGVAEILINAAPTGSETIVIAGATITAAMSAGVNQFARGILTSDTATNIVTLINSANFTATVGSSVVTATGIAANSNQGRNLMYARVKPGASDTVQVMWRIGSTALNHANNSNVAISSAGWGTAPTITQFIGGLSGCWGWFINPAALGQASSIAAFAYGVAMARPTVVKSGTSSTGAIVFDDSVWLRTGAGQTVTVAITANVSRNSGDLNLVADSNLKWTGDSGNGIFELRITNSSTFALNFGIASSITKWSAIKRGGLKVTGYTTGSGSSTTFGTNTSINGEVCAENISIEEDSTTSAASGGFAPFPMLTSNTNGSVVVRNCDINALRALSTARSLGTLGVSSSYTQRYRVEGCTINLNYTGLSQPTTGLFVVASASGPLRAVVSRCRITGHGAYTKPVYSIGAWSTGTASIDLTAEDVEGSAVPANGMAPWVSSQSVSEVLRRIFVSNPDLGGSWRMEQNNGAADWVYGGGFPTLAGLTPGGGIAFSVRTFWLPSPNGQNATLGYRAPQFRQQSRGTTGTKTVTVELFVPTAITYSRTNIRFDFSYVDNTGVLRTESKTGEDIVTSTASWANAGSYSGHAARKVTFTTANQVKQYTDFTLDMTLIGNCPTGFLEYLFVDPAIVLA